MHRNNHYVSRGYLKRWTSDGSRLWSYRLLIPDANVQKWSQKSTRSVAYHEHLYTKAVASGESDEFESWLDAEFESPAEEAIAKVVEQRRLKPGDWTHLARFFAAQDVRTPARLVEQMHEWQNTLPELIQNTLTKTVADLERMTPSERADRAANTSRREDVPFRVTVERRSDESGGVIKAETVSGRPLWLWTMRHVLTGKPLNALCKHRWTILAPPAGVTWFTSDDPVLKVNFNSLTDYSFAGRWGTAGTELILPLGPLHLLYTRIGKPVPARGTEVDAEKAAVIRRLIAAHAHRYVFARTPDPFVEDARPRTVNAAELERERKEWKQWPEQQAKAERDLMGL